MITYNVMGSQMEIYWFMLKVNGQENARGINYIVPVISSSKAKIMAGFNYDHCYLQC